MLFNSMHFLIFFPVVFLTYFIIPYRIRSIFLLLASCYFYMVWRIEYILLVIVSASIDYFAGIAISNASSPNMKKRYLLITILSNLTILFAFKYYNFFIEVLQNSAYAFGLLYDVPKHNLLLPIGISFYTFQAMSYAIDIYRGELRVERNFLKYFLYIMFFPQLVAGPIERAGRLLPQLRKNYDFDYRRVTDGLKLMTWGFFKKLVIADRLAVFVNQVYGDPTHYQGISLILATFFFSFQIYCDFSGYSDIAIGAAQVFGIKLMDNFNRPYFAKSIAEFWKRWHISLSTWFRDYVYIPLGGDRTTTMRWYWNLLITFVVSGLWHGAKWNFILWGALHGFYILLSLWTRKIRARMVQTIGLYKIPIFYCSMRVLITFTLVSFGWIFFRAQNLQDCAYIISHLFSGLDQSVYMMTHFTSLPVHELEPILLGQSKANLAIAFFGIGILLLVHFLQRHIGIRHMLSEKPIWVRWTVYGGLITGIIFLGEYFTPMQFIYFQF